MNVTIAWAAAGDGHEYPLDLGAFEGATIADALALAAANAIELPAFAAVGIWGDVRAIDHLLREGDRIELYRPLEADPKTARRVRAARKR